MELLEQLRKTKEKTLPYYDLPKEDLKKTYAPGKWSIYKILVHLADTEAVLHERIKRVISGPKQVIWGFDQDLWCEKLDYDTIPLEIAKDLYVANRNSIIFLCQKFYSDMGSREWVHSETGLRTLKDEFDKVAWHNEGHIVHMEKALASYY